MELTALGGQYCVLRVGITELCKSELTYLGSPPMLANRSPSRCPIGRSSKAHSTTSDSSLGASWSANWIAQATWMR